MVLKDRLTVALKRGELKPGQLASHIGMTAAGMSKIINGETAELKAVHVFKIARRCRVDPEWLATGEGKPFAGGVRDKQAQYNPLAEFEPKHIDLLRMYKRLPKDIRGPIRAMIEILAASQREDYAEWIRDQRRLLLEEEAST
jgi:hypothetical protein